MVVSCLFWLWVVGVLGIALLLLVLVVGVVSLAVFGVLFVEVVNPPTSQPTTRPTKQLRNQPNQPTNPTNQPVSLFLLRLVSHGRSVVGLLFSSSFASMNYFVKLRELPTTTTTTICWIFETS